MDKEEIETLEFYIDNSEYIHNLINRRIYITSVTNIESSKEQDKCRIEFHTAYHI